MWGTRLLAAALVGLAAFGSLATAHPIVLTNATLLDGVHAQPRRNATVVIRDGRIDAVHTGGRFRAPSDAETIDLAGLWLLPGLIDAHVHLADRDGARAALQAGVTTARSMGAPRFSDVALRELHRSGARDIPEILAAGYHVRRRPHEAVAIDFPELAGLRTDAAGVRRLVRANAQRRVDVIKLMATERAGDPAQDFLVRDLDDETLRAAVAEASLTGLPAAAHAHTDEAARAAVLAGVRTIEHGTLTSASTLRLMRSRRVCLTPTLSFWSDMDDHGGSYDRPELRARAQAMAPRARATVALAAQLGVMIAAGSDMRYAPPSNRTIVDEMADLHASGLSRAAAIRSATAAAARCLGIHHRTGAIRRGLEADMIVLRSDPYSDLAALRDIRLIVNDGHIVRPDSR
ncbi:MAG TPA: amidohydrolase family protein [Vitreimonas sp.]|uniref:amidohydrolase family protein n=1 Tax=Vitreimonas sp. TaxID=3069702 RepID=UPI002D519E3C|nr:amidohydrolase family protein [Vitreimonas sp.]HYD88432.1 amidohydrolase family protein [Vitreimonas sp.]